MTDVVPKTQTYKQFKAKQAQQQAALAQPASGPANGQGTLDAHMGAAEQQATNGASHDAMEVDSDETTPAANDDDASELPVDSEGQS